MYAITLICDYGGGHWGDKYDFMIKGGSNEGCFDSMDYDNDLMELDEARNAFNRLKDAHHLWDMGKRRDDNARIVCAIPNSSYTLLLKKYDEEARDFQLLEKYEHKGEAFLKFYQQ